MNSQSETSVNWDRNQPGDPILRSSINPSVQSLVTQPHNLNEIFKSRNDSFQSVRKKIRFTPYSSPGSIGKGIILDQDTNVQGLKEENTRLKAEISGYKAKCKETNIKIAKLESLNQNLKKEIENIHHELLEWKLSLFQYKTDLGQSVKENNKKEKKINRLKDEIQYLIELNQRYINEYGLSNNYVFDPKNIRYIEQGLLGTGTFSNVNQIILENEKNFTEQCYALKAYKKSIEDMDPNKRKKYQNEISINLLLNHPYIVKFFGYCRISNQSVHPSLLFEYVENGNLENKIQYLDKFSKAKIIMQILLAIFYLHEKCGIIHRDLKPSNILVDKNNNIKICDFGEAILNNCIVNQKCGVGTPRYRAPETKDGFYNSKCDVFSFGVIMYSIITNDLKRNFGSDIDFDSFKKTFPADVCEYVPSLIYDCLEAEYEERMTIKRVYDTIYQYNFLIFNSVLIDKVTIPISDEYGTSIFPSAKEEEDIDDDS